MSSTERPSDRTGERPSGRPDQPQGRQGRGGFERRGERGERDERRDGRREGSRDGNRGGYRREERDGRGDRDGRDGRDGRDTRDDRRPGNGANRRGNPRRDFQYDYVPASYPRTIPQPPERPDYEQMRQAQEKLNEEIAKKGAAIAELRTQARALVARRSGDKSAYIDPVLRQEATELNTEFRGRLATQKAVREQLDQLEARSRDLRDQFGPLSRMTEDEFKEYLQERTYEYEHTSTSVQEERAAKAELARLEAMLPLIPELEQLNKQRTELRERHKAARAAVDELRGRKDEIDKKMSAARASASEIINEKEAINQELSKVDAQRDALQGEIDALKKKRAALEAAFSEKLAAVLRVERAQERALLDKRILRRRWFNIIPSLRDKGVSVEETGEDTGVFVVKNWEVKTVAAIPGNEEGFIKSQLVSWCQAALQRNQFGTVTPNAPDTKGKRGRSVGELDFQVLDLLGKLGLPASRVADKESVLALVEELQQGDKEKEESALRAANDAIRKDLSALEALHAELVRA